MYCSKCGKEITDDSKFCEYCGNDITEVNINNRLNDKKTILCIIFILISIVMICIGIHFLS